MNIDRHNYETFFLLYVDNELSAAEKKAVDVFVQDNIDLQPELQLLIEATLPIDTINFDASALYKNEIELDSLQENLLLHLDNELDTSATNEIAGKILLDNNLKKEWQIWEQTKLDASEQIIFKDKKSLYRKEETRVVSIRFWRIAAAAAILLFCLFTGIAVLKKDKVVENSVAKNGSTANDKKESGNGNLNTEIKPAANDSTLKEKFPSENIASVNTPQIQSTEKNVLTVDGNSHEKLVDKGTQGNLANDQKINNAKTVLEKPSLENINNQKSNETVTSTVLTNRSKEAVSPERAPNELIAKSMKDKIAAPTNPIIDYNSIPPMPDSYATTAVSNEGAVENNNKIFYMNEETVARSKVGGIFRRVKRVVERNTNIKAGNAIKIAGFEIALK